MCDCRTSVNDSRCFQQSYRRDDSDMLSNVIPIWRRFLSLSLSLSLLLCEQEKLGYWIDCGMQTRGYNLDSWLHKDVFLFSETSRMGPTPTQSSTQWLTGTRSTGLQRPWRERNIELRVKGAILMLPPYTFIACTVTELIFTFYWQKMNTFVYPRLFEVSHNKVTSLKIFCFRNVGTSQFRFSCSKWYINIVIIIIIYLSWSWATCWPVPVSRIQKSLQRSAMIPSASWGIAFHYPG